MSVPHLLVVDDSEAILAYESAALSSHYTLSTAANGREALDKLREIRPAAMLLDLSMPEMTGDEVLLRMQADRVLCRIPVIVVSSETARGEASLERGARAFLPKPLRAPELRAIVARVLEEERRRSRADEIAVLFVGVGPMELGIPLESVREVLPQPMTQSAPLGLEYLSEMIDYRGTAVLVLDLALWLGVAHAEPLHERKLVVSSSGDHLLAISVDRVRDPEACPAQDLLPHTLSAGTETARLAGVLFGAVQTKSGPVAVIDPNAFLSGEPMVRFTEFLTKAIATRP